MKQNTILLASLIVLAAALAGAGVWIYQTQIAPKSRSIIQPGLLVEKQNQIEDETASWQIYRNEEFGYEMQYPNNWRKDINPLYWNTERHGMIFCPPESFPENNDALLNGVGDDVNKGCGSKRRVWSADNGNMMVEGIGEISSEDYAKNWQGKLKDPPLIYLFKTDCEERAYDYVLLGKDGQEFCWTARNSGAPKEIFDKMVSTFKFIEPQVSDNKSDFTGQYSFHDPKNGASSTILVEQLSEKEINFALSVNMGAPGYNSGTIYKTKLFLNDNAAIYENNEYGDCKFRIIFNDEKAIIEYISELPNSGFNCGFGHGVYVNGSYPKTDGNIPDFEKIGPRIN